MGNILVAFSTNAGSTEEVAQAISSELQKRGHTVDVLRMKDAQGDRIETYDAIIVGAPMILGWHADARKFIKKNQAVLAHKHVVYFCTLMSLTASTRVAFTGIPISMDPWLPKAPKNPQRLSYRENYATLDNYLQPIVKAAPALKPVSFGFFGGKLELFRLKWWQSLFVMAVIQAQPGDLRNWEYIQKWAGELDSLLFTEG
jgi:menaquinone-dependent protoporphyrinogen IX oxidase